MQKLNALHDSKRKRDKSQLKFLKNQVEKITWKNLETAATKTSRLYWMKFGAKPVEPKTKLLSKKFCQLLKVFTTHRTETDNRIGIYFFFEITLYKLTKSIKNELKI